MIYIYMDLLTDLTISNQQIYGDLMGLNQHTFFTCGIKLSIWF